jgi:hypothetical protein
MEGEDALQLRRGHLHLQQETPLRVEDGALNPARSREQRAVRWRRVRRRCDNAEARATTNTTPQLVALAPR